jgi:protease-4
LFAQGPKWGVAAVDDPWGMRVNPGYLGLGYGAETALWGTFNSDSLSNIEIENSHGFLMNLDGIGFGYDRTDKVYRWTLGMGAGDASFGFGYLHTWSAADEWGGGWKNGWIFGAIARPVKYVSLGWSYEDTPEYKETHRFGVALRPATWRVSLFADAIKPNELEWKDLMWGAGGELHIIDGIRLFGRYDFFANDSIAGTFDQFSLGVRFDNPFSGVGAVAVQGLEDEFDQYTVYSVTSAQQLRSLIPMPKHALRLDITGDFAERPRGGIFSSGGKSFSRLIRTLDKAADDNEIVGLVIKWENPSLSIAQAEELKNTLEKFKGAGKPILLFSKTLGNIGYYVASVADYIAISPTGGGVDITGLRAEMMFFKGTLDKLGIKGDFLHAGQYKSAMEMFTRTEPSEAAAKNMNEILDALDKEFISGIARARKLSFEKVKAIVDNGPYTDLESDSLGLVDSLMYWEDFENYVKKTRKLKATPFGAYAMRDDRKMDWGAPDKIAVIVIDGNIVDGNGGGGGLFGGNSTGDKEIIEAVNAAKKDRSVKGILLRIDSGGGSAMASDLMAHALKQAAEKKPLVVSMGGMAASGGYYVAAPGAKIFADNSTLTGSIGVIMGKFSIKGLYEKIGITRAVFSRGENSGIFSMSDTFSTFEKERLGKGIERSYSLFKSNVAKGRGLTMDSVEVVAQGRVWAGSDARNIGLVDSIGGFIDALKYLVEETGVDSRDLDVVIMPSGGMFSLEAVMNMTAKMLPFGDRLDEIPTFPYEDNEPLYLMPYSIEIK